MGDRTQGVGNCGYIDPLLGAFEDEINPEKVPPWWVPLIPADPISSCQAWAAFLHWWCEPKRIWSGRDAKGMPKFTPEGQHWWDSAYAVGLEFAGDEVAFCGYPLDEWDRCTRPADHEGECA